ncbi:MAG: hypothetical protein ASARMPREDX12_000055 [Alectoria sarmentosa]|nr:MAG: hypothetical protein ASARMPREDX12_000055 [Alectoria sarmentosa]
MSFLPLAKDFKDPRSIFNPDDLAMKLTNAEPYREVTPFGQDMTEEYRETAYEYHDTLVEMGGRPTRSVLDKPVGKVVYKKKEGVINILDEHGKLTCTLEHDMSPMHHHWTKESSRFEEELDRWKEFQGYQRKNPHLSPLNTSFDLRDVDLSLKAILLRLNEWREFEVYHQCKVNDALMSTWASRQALTKLFQEKATSDLAGSKPNIQSMIDRLLERLFPRQMALDACQKQLTCIESQAFEILSEASASLEGAPLLCLQLEKKMEEQANAVYQDLELLEARPSRPAQASFPTATYVQRILHWKSETSRLLKERREWKIFLKWRRNQASASTSVSTKERQPNSGHADPALWFDYVTYQKSQLDKAWSWVECWRGLQRSTEKQIETLTKAGIPTLGGSIESIEQYVERFQQDVHTAEAQLRSAQQYFAELSSQQIPLAAHEGTQQSTDCQQMPPSAHGSDASGSRFNEREHLNLRVSPTKAHRPSLRHKVLGSVHPSSIPGRVRKMRAKKGNTERGQLISVSHTIVPDQVILDEDIQMPDAPNHLYLHEAIGEIEGAEPIDTLMSGIKDTMVVDAGSPLNTSPPPISKVDSKGRGARAIQESALPIHQIPTSRKTRSATKLDQAISNRILKKAHKKTDKRPAKNAKTFTEQQIIGLLNTALSRDSSTESPLLRRSERLKKKAAAPAVILPPQVSAAQHAQSSRQKKRKIASSHIESSLSSRQKKRKA